MLNIKSDYLTVNINKLVALMQIKAEKLLLEKYSINYNQFLVLHTINTLHSPTQLEIAQSISMTGAGVSKIILILEKYKLINKKINKNNKRANIINLTAQGKEKIQSSLIQLEKEFDLYITKSDRKNMSHIINKTIENLLTTYEKK